MIVKQDPGVYHDTTTGFNIYVSLGDVCPVIQARRDAVIGIDGGVPEKRILECNLLKQGPYRFDEMIWKGEAIDPGHQHLASGRIVIGEGPYHEVSYAFEERCDFNIVSPGDMEEIVLDYLKLGDPVPTSTPAQAEE